MERKRKILNTEGSIDLKDLKRNKYFRTLLGSYCLLMEYCHILNIEEFVNKHIDDNELIIEFIKYTVGEEISEDYQVSSFNVDAAAAQIKSGVSAKK